MHQERYNLVFDVLVLVCSPEVVLFAQEMQIYSGGWAWGSLSVGAGARPGTDNEALTKVINGCH